MSRDVENKQDLSFTMWVKGATSPLQETTEYRFNRWLHIILSIFSCVLLWSGWNKRRFNPRSFAIVQRGSWGSFLSVLFYRNMTCFLRSSTALCVLVSFFFHLSDDWIWELNVLAIAVWFAFIHVIELLTFFEFPGVLITRIVMIVVGDITTFFLIYAVLLVGFAFAMLLVFQYPQHEVALSFSGSDKQLDLDFPSVMLTLVYASVASGDYTSVYFSTHSPLFSQIVALVWGIFSYIILLKVLIAVMQGRFIMDHEYARKVWLFPFADQILKFERALPPSQRARLRTGKPAATHVDLLTETEMRECPYYIIALQSSL